MDDLGVPPFQKTSIYAKQPWVIHLMTMIMINYDRGTPTNLEKVIRNVGVRITRPSHM